MLNRSLDDPHLDLRLVLGLGSSPPPLPSPHPALVLVTPTPYPTGTEDHVQAALSTLLSRANESGEPLLLRGALSTLPPELRGKLHPTWLAKEARHTALPRNNATGEDADTTATFGQFMEEYLPRHAPPLPS